MNFEKQNPLFEEDRDCDHAQTVDGQDNDDGTSAVDASVGFLPKQSGTYLPAHIDENGQSATNEGEIDDYSNPTDLSFDASMFATKGDLVSTSSADIEGHPAVSDQNVDTAVTTDIEHSDVEASGELTEASIKQIAEHRRAATAKSEDGLRFLSPTKAITSPTGPVSHTAVHEWSIVRQHVGQPYGIFLAPVMGLLKTPGRRRYVFDPTSSTPATYVHHDEVD